MSGPKVVRIITREEILEICLGHIAQVEAALAEWERLGSRNKVIDDHDRARYANDVKRLKQLIEQNRFLDVQKRAPELLRSLRSDMSQRLEAMYSAEAAARRRQYSLRLSAKQLQKELQEARVALPNELRDGLAAATSNVPITDEVLQKVVADALRMLPERAPDATEDHSELLQQLRVGDKSQTLDDWLKRSQPDPISSAVETLDHYLAQLATCDDPEKLEQLTGRATSATSELDSSRRKMLIDSLCIEAASVVRTAQRRLQWRQAAADERAAAVAAGDTEACDETFRSLDVHLRNDDFAGVRACLDRIKQLRADAARSRAALAGRSALLGGLKELGYQVNEGMVVAWTKNKRLVVHHPTMPGVAVELGGVNDESQFQARVVAVQGENRDARNDKQTETAWCGELSKIQARIRENGGELNIDRALPAGAQALKIVTLEQTDDDELIRPQVRHLK